MECVACSVVGKTITKFNVRLNNHHTDSKNPNSDNAPSDLHFSDNRHDFNRNAIFTTVEKTEAYSKTDEEKERILLKEKNVWIKTFETLNIKMIKPRTQ